MPENNNKSIPKDWAVLLEEYQRRKDWASAMGKPEKLAQRQEQGRLNAREMIVELLDENSFMELGSLVGSHSYRGEAPLPCDGVVGGIGRIQGQAVVIAAEDFSVKGGSIGPAADAKRLRLALIAEQEQLPYVLMLDGAGHRMSDGSERHAYSANDMQVIARLKGQVPTVAIIYGASAGHGAISGVLMDFVIMTESACLFAAGPALVAAATGEQISKEDLGNAEMHTLQSAVCHNRVADEKAACALARQYLSYTRAPESDRKKAKDSGKDIERDIGPRVLDQILTTIPANNQLPYDMHKLITQLVNEGEYLEFQPEYARNLICAFAKLGEQRVAIVANQPTVMAGAISAEAADKAAYFLELAEQYRLPVVFLADNPGILSGSKAEQAGTLRSAGRMFLAQSRLSVPKLHVTLRKAYGFGSSLMAMNPFDKQSLSLALPGISLGGMPAKGGDVAARLNAEEAAASAAAQASGAWSAGDNMAYDEIIDPRELRNALLQGLVLRSA